MHHNTTRTVGHVTQTKHTLHAPANNSRADVPNDLRLLITARNQNYYT